MRAALPAEVYVWINAVKGHALHGDELAAWHAIDPLFPFNRTPSEPRPICAAGERAITVDGDGTMRRCHFIAEPIGNLYDRRLASRALAPRACTQVDCHCHIGYVHLDYLELDKVFATGLLERIAVPEARAAGVRLPVVH